MPEEKTSYLEPAEDNSIQEKSVSEVQSENAPEKLIAPELGSEKKSEIKSDNEALYQKILSSVGAATAYSDSDVSDDAKKISLKVDADSKVSQLVDLAVTKGVVHAVKVARSLNDFYILDQMHDDLVNRLYESLKEKGLISE